VSIFPLALPATRPERLDLLVAAHAEKHLSRPLEEMILDYSILPETIRRPGEEATAALVFAAPRATVEGAMSALEAIGLRVARLLTPACIHARRARTAASDRRLVISTGEDATSISVVENGHVLLERILAWGRTTLLRRIETELGLAPEHARTLLDRHVATARLPADSDSPGSALREVLAPVFRELTGETAGCLAYCSSVFRHAPIRGAIVVGALTGHGLLAEAMEHELGGGIERPADGAGLALARFATPIGCAAWSQETRP
jgi:Tfp pilus assembly PilM family ATPase